MRDRTDRKTAAKRFLRYIRQSNELHAEYLEDQRLLECYNEFCNWQLGHLLSFFSDLHAEAGYTEAIDFVMSDLAGVGISDRDHELERAAPAISKLLPTGALVAVATAAELNARILSINISICQCLRVGNKLPNPLTEYDYCIASRAASSFEECTDLLHLVTGLGRSLSSLIRIPMIGITLRAMRSPAHAAGFGALQEFLEKGYRTFKQIPDIEHFLGEIENRMIQVFERIYSLPEDQLRRDADLSQLRDNFKMNLIK